MQRLTDELERLSMELEKATVAVSNPAKYGEGMLEKPSLEPVGSAVLGQPGAEPAMPMAQLLAELQLQHPEKYFVCPQCEKITR